MGTYDNIYFHPMFLNKIIDIIVSYPILRRLSRFIYDRGGSILFRIFWIFPVNKEKIVFCNYNGGGYGDNPKYIAEEFLSRDKSFKMVWLILPEKLQCADLPPQIKSVPWYSFRAMYELATAAVWIDNNRKEGYVRKRRGQLYVQTWHGGFALKKVEADLLNPSKWYVRNAKNDSKMADVFISGSKIQSTIYHHSFWYDGQILEVGYPRNDPLISLNIESNYYLLSRQKISSSIVSKFTYDHVLLYAPTFRGNAPQSSASITIDFQRCITALQKKFGGKWIVLVRLHPSLSRRFKELNTHEPYVFDVSSYADMQELLGAADVLITDYSSCMFDFALTNRPCYLYVPDLEEYCNDDRGFYINIKDLPFPLFQTNDELVEGIYQHNENQYHFDVRDYLKRNGSFDTGVASQKVVDWILERMI